MNTTKKPSAAAGNSDRRPNRLPGSAARSSGFDSTPGALACQLMTNGGRSAGRVIAGTLRKSISASRHLLKKPPAIAFDVSVLEDAARLGAVRVEVRDTESGTVYRAELADFWQYALRLNRGFGKQLALPLNRWRVRGTTPDGQLPLLPQ